MPTSSRAERAFGVMSSPTSAATPALSARQASPLSSARALKIASAIGLRQTFAVHTKRIRLVWFAAVSPSLIYPLPLYPFGLLYAPSIILSRNRSSLHAPLHYRTGRVHYRGRARWERWAVNGRLRDSYHRALTQRLDGRERRAVVERESPREAFPLLALYSERLPQGLCGVLGS